MNSTTVSSAEPINRRILVIDDNPAIHEDFKKVLGGLDAKLGVDLEADEEALFGDAPEVTRAWSFEIDSAFQGQEGLQKVRTAAAKNAPYAVAFVDVRMPPGWDGIETITRIWAEFPDLQIVICTAFSDYSWDQIASAVGNSDHVLVLKKPFDNVEVLQMAHALSKKWQLTQIANRQFAELDAMVSQRTEELREANHQLIREVKERTAAEERFSKAFHGSPLPMAIQYADGSGFLDINDSFLSLLGASREMVVNGATVLWTDDETDSQIAAELAAHNVVRNLAASIMTQDGERQVLAAADSLELNGDYYRLLVLQDITERVRIETELRQSQKMEAVGRLAAGVAHDFNNILTVILGNASMQAGNPLLDEKMTASLRHVVLAAERATTLTRQLLAYSRKQLIQRHPMSLNETVERTAAKLRRVLGSQITLELELAADLPAIHADVDNVEQVIMNLALNSRDAMPDGGKLTLTTSVSEIDDAVCKKTPGARVGRFASVVVKDTGHGMDSATLSRLFEPFFTTKEQGKGTGMGLATVYGVMRQHNGWVDVQSQVGRGATISAYFPFSSDTFAAKSEETVPVPTGPISDKQITILVVEDEDLLREFVSEALQALGYRILSAPNGHEALEIWAQHSSEIDLLLTDIVMPKSISGRHLAHKLVMERPDLKVIFTSGYSAELIESEFEQDSQHGFLPKPYLAKQLEQTVAAHLQGTPATR